jgi:predicted nucleic acid-binding protein
MNTQVLPDTDILVDFFRGHEKAVSFIREYESDIILSAIVVAELYAGVKGESEEAVLGEFVSLFRIVPVTADIARSAGMFKRDYGRSHGVGLADAVLAATAIAEKAELQTLNTRHYPMLKGLRPAYRKQEVSGYGF